MREDFFFTGQMLKHRAGRHLPQVMDVGAEILNWRGLALYPSVDFL